MTNRIYKFLTQHFFKGTQRGQINSLWKKRDIPDRIEEYKKALDAGHCQLIKPLNRGEVKRMTIMGIEIPEHLKPVKKERPPRPPKQPRDPNEIRLTNKQVVKLRSFGIEIPEEMLPLRVHQIKENITAPEENSFTAKDVQELEIPDELQIIA